MFETIDAEMALLVGTAAEAVRNHRENTPVSQRLPRRHGEGYQPQLRQPIAKSGSDPLAAILATGRPGFAP
jgi:hypothetical protein